MEPANIDLIDAVIEVLEDRIAPSLRDDPWAASELRSIEAVLVLVRSRLENETRFLARDNERLQRLLESLGEPALPVVEPGDAAARNVWLRASLERRLPGLHDGCHQTDVAAVRKCLHESALDEEALYGPLGGRRPF